MSPALFAVMVRVTRKDLGGGGNDDLPRLRSLLRRVRHGPTSLLVGGLNPYRLVISRNSLAYLQVSLTIFRLVTRRSAYSSLLDALTTPSRFSSPLSCALDSLMRGPVTVTV